MDYTFECELGAFSIALNPEKAPATCRYFSEQFASEEFAEASVFRIVTEQNSSLRQATPIEVVQLGISHGIDGPHDDLVHESTEITGLRHKQWTVSAARFALGKAYPSFFVCMRDEPSLDHGGERHEDGQGFAAFGEVVAGFETLNKIFGCAEATDFLSQPIPISLKRQE